MPTLRQEPRNFLCLWNFMFWNFRKGFFFNLLKISDSASLPRPCGSGSGLCSLVMGHQPLLEDMENAQAPEMAMTPFCPVGSDPCRLRPGVSAIAPAVCLQAPDSLLCPIEEMGQIRCRVRTGESGLVLCGGMELRLNLALGSSLRSPAEGEGHEGFPPPP